MNAPLRAVIYCRVSSEEQAENGTSLETQELACLRKAAELGASVVGVFRDEGVSGGLYLTREGLQSAIAEIETAKASLLIIAKRDRMARDLDAARDIQRRVAKAGGRIVSCDGLNFENNAIGRFVASQIDGFAEYEKEAIRERTWGGRNRRAEQGIQPYRTLSPYGYTVATTEDVLTGRANPEDLGVYRVNESEARWVREIFSLYAAGASLRGVGRHLDSLAVPTPKGGQCWHMTSLRSILRNPVYKGEAACRKTEVLRDETRKTEKGFKHVDYIRDTSPDRWITIPAPAIIDEATWEECQRRLTTNQSEKSGNPASKYLLTGLVFCPACNRRMMGSTATKENRTFYRCRAAGTLNHRPTVSFTADRVERAVYAAIEYVLAQPESIEAAFAAWEQEKARKAKSGNPTTLNDAARIEAAIAEVDMRERTAARAQVEAMMKGRSTAAYDDILTECHRQRVDLQAQLAKVQPVVQREARLTRIDAREARVTAEKCMAALRTVLYSDMLSKREKRDAVAGFVSAVRPTESEIGIEFRPFVEAGEGETVQQVLS